LKIKEYVEIAQQKYSRRLKMKVKCPKCKCVINKTNKKKSTPVQNLMILMENDKNWYDFMKKQLIKNLNKEKIHEEKEN
jgi:hypothetical protein